MSLPSCKTTITLNVFVETLMLKMVMPVSAQTILQNSEDLVSTAISRIVKYVKPMMFALTAMSLMNW